MLSIYKRKKLERKQGNMTRDIFGSLIQVCAVAQLAMGKIVLCNGGKLGMVFFSVADSFRDFFIFFYYLMRSL